MDRLVRQTAGAMDLSVAQLSAGGTQRHLVPVRQRITAAARREHGLSVAVVAEALGISPRTVLRAVQLSLVRVQTENSSR